MGQQDSDQKVNYRMVTRLLPAFGKEGEQEELWKAVLPDLLKMARGLLKDYGSLQYTKDPGELVNDVVVECSHKKLTFENTRAFRAYVWRTMANNLKDAKKRGGKFKPRTTMMLTLSSADKHGHEDVTVDRVAFREVLERLRKLDEQQAEALELHYVGEFTLKECAEIMDMSVSSVKRLLASEQVSAVKRLLASKQWFETQLRQKTNQSK